MSWGFIYRLPWHELDTGRIEEAARAVAASLPGTLLKIAPRPHFPGAISCYFGVPVSLARRLEPSATDLDEKIASAGPLGIADPPWVQIDFVASDEERPPGSGFVCYFEFDTSRSGNGLCSGAACEIAERLGRHFGVSGRPSWEVGL
jgi:hypothetical protein